MQKFKPQTPALRKLVATLGSDSLNSKALRGTAAGQASLRKAQTQLSAHAAPPAGLTAWERFSAPLPPEKLIRQQLMVANGSRPGRFKYNGVAALGLDLPSGPVSGYKAARAGSKDTSHDRADRLGRSTNVHTEANLMGGWAAWEADSPPRTRTANPTNPTAPPRTERRKAWASASAPGLSPSHTSCHASATAPGGLRFSGRPSSAAAGPAGGGAPSSASGPGHPQGAAAGRAARPASAQVSRQVSRQTSQQQTSQQAGQLAEGSSGGQGAGNPNQGAEQGLLRRLRFDAASGFEYDAKGMQAAPGPLTLGPNPNPSRGPNPNPNPNGRRGVDNEGRGG